MRILYYTNEDMRESGGGRSHFLEMAKSLKRLGHVIEVGIPGYRPYTGSFGDLSVFRIPTLRKHSVGYLLFELVAIPHLVLKMLCFRPDFIYGRIALVHYLPVLFARILGIPYLLEQNGIAEDEFRIRGFNRLLVFVLKWTNLLCMRSASLVVAVTDGIKQQLIDRYRMNPQAIIVIPNGVNASTFKPLPMDDCRNRLGLDKGSFKDSFIVGFVGSFAPWQGIDELVEAFERIKKLGYNDIKAVLVGSGENKEEIEWLVRVKKLEAVIHMTGMVEHDLVPFYINAFNICFLSKRGLSFGFSPLKLYEYMACGKPIVASQVSGISETIALCGCGFLFEPGNIKAIASTIIEAYTDRANLHMRGMRGRSLVESKFTWDSLASQVLAAADETLRTSCESQTK